MSDKGKSKDQSAWSRIKGWLIGNGNPGNCFWLYGAAVDEELRRNIREREQAAKEKAKTPEEKQPT